MELGMIKWTEIRYAEYLAYCWAHRMSSDNAVFVVMTGTIEESASRRLLSQCSATASAREGRTQPEGEACLWHQACLEDFPDGTLSMAVLCSLNMEGDMNISPSPPSQCFLHRLHVPIGCPLWPRPGACPPLSAISAAAPASIWSIYSRNNKWPCHIIEE